MPKVSVIVPNYGHAAFLEERFASIAAQRMTDLEIILLDDASTDNSLELIRAFAAREPRVRHVVTSERNSGSAFVQWRKGIALAEGEWIWIAESDDACDPSFLERLLALDTANDHRLGLAYTRSAIVDEQGKPMGYAPLPPAQGSDPFAQDLLQPGTGFLREHLAARNVVPNASAAIFRRALVQDERIWRDTAGMQLCGDWLFWCRLVPLTTVGYLGDALNRFRYHQGVTRRHVTLERKRQRLREEAIVRSELALDPEVEQHAEINALDRAWYDLFPVSALFSAELGKGRVKGQGAAAFRLRFLLHRSRGRVRRR